MVEGRERGGRARCVLSAPVGGPMRAVGAEWRTGDHLGHGPCKPGRPEQAGRACRPAGCRPRGQTSISPVFDATCVLGGPDWPSARVSNCDRRVGAVAPRATPLRGLRVARCSSMGVDSCIESFGERSVVMQRRACCHVGLPGAAHGRPACTDEGVSVCTCSAAKRAARRWLSRQPMERSALSLVWTCGCQQQG